MAFGRFRVEWPSGWIVLNMLRIAWNILKSCLNGCGLVIEYVSIGIELIVCSLFEYK